MGYDGTHFPDPEAAAEAEEKTAAIFEREGKERAPRKYDAEWIVSRSHPNVQPKVRELIAFLKRILPKECEFDYDPHGLQVRYRGVRCVGPHIQQSQIWLHVAHKGWVPGIRVTPATDLNREIKPQLLEQFKETRRQIDSLLDSKRR